MTTSKRGRKPLPDKDKKQTISIFIPKSVVDKHGGAEKLKLKLKEYVHK